MQRQNQFQGGPFGFPMVPFVMDSTCYPPPYQNDNDLFINSIVSGGPPGPQGPPGPAGPQGAPGTPGLVPVTDVATATYTALATDYMLCVLTNGAVTITLPTGIRGTVYIVKDCFGDANNNPIIIQGTGGQLVDGSIATINSSYGSIQLIFNGTDWSIV